MYFIKEVKQLNGTVSNIYIIGDKIHLNIPPGYSNEQFELVKLDKNMFISPGWIDSHVHCDETNQLYGSVPDRIGYKTGVTTLIDAGSVGIDNLEKLFLESKKSITNIKCLLNISSQGIFKQSELADLKMIDISFDQKKYKNFVVGFKARMSKSVTLDNNTSALRIFNEMRKNSNLPLMVHVGNEPPRFEDICDLLNRNDIITHIFNFKNNSIFDDKFKPTLALQTAISRKIKFDVGHGTESFNYECALKAIKNNFDFHLISTDIYRTNMENGVVGSLAEVMSKIKSCGLSWEKIIEKVTKNPARIFNLKNEGEIKDGFNANLTIFKIVSENKKVVDSHKNGFEIKELIKPVLCFINGRKMEVNIDGE